MKLPDWVKIKRNELMFKLIGVSAIKDLNYEGLIKAHWFREGFEPGWKFENQRSEALIKVLYDLKTLEHHSIAEEMWRINEAIKDYEEGIND